MRTFHHHLHSEQVVERIHPDLAEDTVKRGGNKNVHVHLNSVD